MEENQEIKKANDIYNELMDNVQEVNRAIRREMFLSDIASIRDEGEQKGIQKEKVEIAKRMLEKNKPLDEIIEFTGLTKEEIEELK